MLFALKVLVLIELTIEVFSSALNDIWSWCNINLIEYSAWMLAYVQGRREGLEGPCAQLSVP